MTSNLDGVLVARAKRLGDLYRQKEVHLIAIQKLDAEIGELIEDLKGLYDTGQ